MKRRIVAAMLAGVMALGMLAGCGGSGKSDSDGGSSDKISAGQDVLERYVRASGICACDQRRAGDPDR